MIDAILLEDAKDSLLASLALPRDGEATTSRILSDWVLGDDLLPSERNGHSRVIRNYKTLAVECLLETADDFERVNNGLEWLSDVSLERAGNLSPLCLDAISQLMLSTALRRREVYPGWFRDILEAAPTEAEPKWLRGAAHFVLGQDVEELATIVKVALTSRLVIEAAAIEEAQARFLVSLKAGWKPQSPLQAAFALAAYRFSRRPTPIALPGRASIEDLLNLLNRTEGALRRWTWDTKKKVYWDIKDERHFQNLLWAILFPVFPDLREEEWLPSTGHHHPRTDFLIPSLSLAIEVKYLRKGTQRELKEITGQVAEDSAVYLMADSPAKQLLAVIWDDSCSVDQHATLVNGISRLQNVVGTVIVSRPSRFARDA